ncbi:E3 ubiquitin-protein ligase SIAH1A-like [Schistocerca nitens]|uniref:E3 ubiquitin-protein ligase SIAH1A-like n=1 Tax=Schistocerca nitens TaxID=7011 RepID=UPI0021174938|nr:E3 ubiquitin-protein ligase SIAH1A-like [Schistocerca nitens]
MCSWSPYCGFLLGSMRTQSADMTQVVRLPSSPRANDSGALEQRRQQLARCRACSFLMVGQVSCCPNSHATCCSQGGKCRVCGEPLLPPSTYTLNLQQLAAAEPVVQCAQPGCPERAPLPQMAAHERICAHRPMRCLVEPDTCSWHGRRADLEAHTQAQHPHHFVRFPSTAGASVSWRISKQGCCVDLTRHLVMALGETFVYQKEFCYPERQLYIAVQLVGPPERSMRFRYKFELTRNEAAHSVTFERAVHSEDEDLKRAAGLGDCIKVPYDTITQFCHGERVVVLCKAKYPYKHELPITHL